MLKLLAISVSLIIISIVSTAGAQPKSVVAECYTSSNVKINVLYIASELDVYRFELDDKTAKASGKYWNILLKNSFIVDYNYNFGKVVKTESLDGYFLLLKPTKAKVLEINIHQATGTKTLVKSLSCERL